MASFMENQQRTKICIIIFVCIFTSHLKLTEAYTDSSTANSVSSSDEDSSSSEEYRKTEYHSDIGTLNDPSQPGGGGCEDKIPNCNQYLSMCCSMKDAMNASCAKTCKFCSETPAPPSAPGAPGGAPGAPGGGAAPTASTDQDPCNPDSPPSVTVDAPGQTTTTQSSLPGISMDGLPGQTTTTTQSSVPGFPGMG